jgi:hypothetical protein
MFLELTVLLMKKRKIASFYYFISVKSVHISSLYKAQKLKLHKVAGVTFQTLVSVDIMMC